MRKRFAYLMLAAIGVAGFVGPACASPALKRESGRLQELVARLTSSEYLLRDPATDPRPYVDPTPALNAFRHVAAAMAWGDVRAAAVSAAALDYEVVEFVDAHTQRTYYVLREDLNRIKTARGWGSYIVNPNSRIDVLVEVPHPLDDVETPEIGGVVFEQAHAKGLLIAGAHRLKADVPDLVDSIFHQVHTAWIGPQAQATAWQIHGFVLSKHEFPDGAHVIVSTGDGGIAPELKQLDAICEDQGLASYVFNNRPAASKANQRLNGDVPGVAFVSLAATTNEQGRLSRSLGGSFVHVELESQVRMDAAQRDRIASVIATAMRDQPSRTAQATRRGAIRLASYRPSEDDAATTVGEGEVRDPRVASRIEDGADESTRLVQ